MIKARDKNGQGISEEELIGHVSLLMWGSRDAVTNAIVWTLFLLTQHPDVYQDAISETEAILKGEAPEIEQLGNLPLLENIVKESLLLFPPFPITHRVTGRERELAGYTIPVRTEIGMSIYHTNRMPELYENPKKFNPNRWNSKNPPPLLSFGMGPHGCVEFNSGWQELLIILPTLIQRFRFQPKPRIIVNGEVKVALTRCVHFSYSSCIFQNKRTTTHKKNLIKR